MIDKQKLLNWAYEVVDGDKGLDRTIFDSDEELAAYMEGYSNAILDLISLLDKGEF